MRTNYIFSSNSNAFQIFTFGISNLKEFSFPWRANLKGH